MIRPGLARPEEEQDILKEGECIDSKYKVLKKLGRGGYGEIYACKMLKSGEPVAVKVERVSKPGNLLEEEKILRCLQDCKYVPHLLGSGRHEERLNYIVMELLGENLSVLRRKQTTHRLSLLTTLILGMQMLRSIKEVHDAGFLHRDIKPGNFVMGTERLCNARTVIIIDYGLSRKHLRADGVPKPKRKTARWVGSRRYMSLNTHLRKDQARRDDLWSLLYVLIEFFTGTLPWAYLRGISNLDKVRDLKMQYNNEKLVRGLPEEFLKFMIHIKTLKYSSRPDYDHLHNLLKSLFERNGGNKYTTLDWESPEQAKARPLNLDSIDEDEKKDHTADDLESTSSDSDKRKSLVNETHSTDLNSYIIQESPKEKSDKEDSNSKKKTCLIL